VQIRRVLLGEDPRSLLWLTGPTLLALAIDLPARGSSLVHFAPHGYGFYVGSILLSLAFWIFPLHVAARLLSAARGPRPAAARAGLGALFGLWLFPLTVFCYGGQILYRHVFDAYMGRNSLRLGIAYRGTVGDWFAAWSGPWLLGAVTALGVVITAGLFGLAKRAAASRPARTPWLPAFTFAAALVCFWYDLCDSRYLQAATPDTCFVHGLVHVARVILTGKWHVRQGISVRTPAPLPPLASARAARPNVLVVLGESLRADVLCSRPPPACASADLDAVAADRLPLGRLTTPTPNTFSAFVLFTTGLQADAPFASTHTAPVLWELARAAGYRTAYVTSQNPNYEDFGLFTREAGIDVRATATELGGMSEEQIGSPDERAFAEALRFVREVPPGTPYFAVLQLSNTHQPYRVDPDLQPFAPHSGEPTGGPSQFHNHYRNSVRLLERMLRGFLSEIRATAGWEDTAVVFLSDHGEQFRDHGGLYHNHSLFEEELRIPGFLLAGDHVLAAAERRALADWADRRTFTQDVRETIVDLLGLEPARASLPLASEVAGRSLLRPPPPGEPAMFLATSTAVWEPTDARFGVLSGDRKIVGAEGAPWSCYDLRADPHERKPLPPERCEELPAAGSLAFPLVGRR
jgi:Sulfatase